MSFRDWLILLGRMSSRFIYIVACVRISILFEAENYPITCVCHVSFICLSVDGHLCCFHFLVFVSSCSQSLFSPVLPSCILQSPLLWCLSHRRIRAYFPVCLSHQTPNSLRIGTLSVSCSPLVFHDVEVCLAHMMYTENI